MQAALPPARPARSTPPLLYTARRGEFPIGLRPRTTGRMDCARTAPTALQWPRARLCSDSRGPCPSVRQANSRQANTPELTNRGPRTVSRMDRAGCAVSCGRPWYSRGAQNCGSACSAHKPPARCGSREQRLQAHGARKAARIRVTRAHIEWRALQFRCCSARKPPRSARTKNCDTYGTAKNIQFLEMNLIYFAAGRRKVLLASSPVVIIRSPMRISE
jgi:hypothetical protein